MSVHRAYQVNEGKLRPYEFAWGSAKTWLDVLEHEQFKPDVCMALGRKQGGIRIEVHEARNITAPHQEFTFLIVVRIGETAYPVFCPDLIEFLHFLQTMAPILELDVRCAGEEAAINRMADVMSSLEAPPTENQLLPGNNDNIPVEGPCLPSLETRSPEHEIIDRV